VWMRVVDAGVKEGGRRGSYVVRVDWVRSVPAHCCPSPPSQLVCKQSSSKMLGPDRQALATKAWTAPCACRQPAQRASPLCHTPTTHDVVRLANVLPLSGCQCTAAPATLAVLTALAALPAWAVGTHSACSTHALAACLHTESTAQFPFDTAARLFNRYTRRKPCLHLFVHCAWRRVIASRLASHLTNPYSH
jgi:hypothetical protein